MDVNEHEISVRPDSKYWTEDEYGVGKLFTWQGEFYRFVGVVDAALAEGNLVEYASTPGYVTNDRSGGSSVGRAPAGVAVTACPVGSFCFVQASGVGLSDLTTDGGVAAAEYLMPHATTDGGVDTMADGSEESVFGMAFAADASTTLAAGKYILKGVV